MPLTKYEQALFEAAKSNNLSEIRELCSIRGTQGRKANPNCKNRRGFSPCHMAAGHGNVEAIRVLCELDADINQSSDSGKTPCHSAAENSKAEVIRLLHSLGADINRVDDDGITPLHRATLNNRTSSVEVLLDCGCNIDIKIKPNARAFRGKTAMDIAIGNISPNIINLIKQARERNERRQELVESQQLNYTGARVPSNVQARLSDSDRALIVAAKNNSIDDINKLCRQGLTQNQKANPNCIDEKGWSPCTSAAFDGHVEAIQALYNYGANLDQPDKDGLTPSHLAAMRGRTNVLRILHDLGADVEKVEPNDGRTPCHAAAGEGHRDVILALHDIGADIDKAGFDGATPLYMAAWNGHHEIIRLLKSFGADVDKLTNKNESPCLAAAYDGHEESIRTLSQLKADIDRPNIGGVAPIHMAIIRNKVKAVRALVECGCDINCKIQSSKSSYAGKSPLEIAKSKGNEEIIRLLKEAHERNKRGKAKARRGVRRVPAGGTNKNSRGHASVARPARPSAGPSGGPELRTHPSRVPGNAQVIKLSPFQPKPDCKKSYEEINQEFIKAAKGGYDRDIRSLLKEGVDFYYVDADGKNALHHAVENNWVGIIRLLLDSGASIEFPENRYMSPLCLAAIAGEPRVLKLLISNGARLGTAKRQLMLSYPPNYLILTKDNRCRPILIEAIRKDTYKPRNKSMKGDVVYLNQELIRTVKTEGYFRDIDELVSAGADIHYHDELQMTVLHYAALSRSLPLLAHIVEEYPEIDVNARSKFGFTALHLAARFNSGTHVGASLNQGAQVDAKNEEECTPLHIAAYCGNAETIGTLIDCEADVFVKNIYGQTAYDLAKVGGHVQCAELLKTEMERRITDTSVAPENTPSSSQLPTPSAPLVAEENVKTKPNTQSKRFSRELTSEFTQRITVETVQDIMTALADQQQLLKDIQACMAGKVGITSGEYDKLQKVLLETQARESVIQERKRLKEDVALDEYYTTFQLHIRCVYIAASTVYTDMADNQKTGKLSMVSGFIERISGAVDIGIPFAGNVLRLIKNVLSDVDKNQQQRVVNHIINFAVNTTEMDALIEQVARHLTYQKARIIKEKHFATANRGGKARARIVNVYDKLTANRDDTPIKKYAASDAEKVIEFISAGKLEGCQTKAEALVQCVCGPSPRPRGESTPSPASEKGKSRGMPSTSAPHKAGKSAREHTKTVKHYRGFFTSDSDIPHRLSDTAALNIKQVFGGLATRHPESLPRSRSMDISRKK